MEDRKKRFACDQGRSELDFLFSAVVDGFANGPPPAGFWSEASSVAVDVATVLGIAAGGTWAYYKFLKGQTFHAHCLVSLEPCLVTVGGCPALQVDVSIKNAGLTPILLPNDSKRELSITAIDQLIWEDARDNDGIVLWDEGLKHTQKILGPETWKLQSQEGLYWSLVVPLPEEHCCYLVRLEVEGIPHRFVGKDRKSVWETLQIVVPKSG
jgi:hypothetical protein